MAAVQTPNHRASLLSGLRTGGVRSTSGPMGNFPHTAAPGGSFAVPRFTSTKQHHNSYPEEDQDEIADMQSQNHFSNSGANRPMTAAIDGARFSQQQTRMNANSPAFVPGFAVQTPQAQAQAMQEMQMLQMELLRLQVSFSIEQIHLRDTDVVHLSPSRHSNTRQAFRLPILPSWRVSK